MTPAQFENLARQVLSRFYRTSLAKRAIHGFPKKFDLVSPDGTIVGDAKFYTLVQGNKIPPAKWSVIAEHVWLLEKAPGREKFLVFGNDRRVPEWWLRRYGALLPPSIRFFFLYEDGRLAPLGPLPNLPVLEE